MKISTFTMKDLLGAGAHYGHIREKYNPKMKQYIFGLREGVHLIDLEQTVLKLSSALVFIQDLKKQGKNILFVCTKPQVNNAVKEIAIKNNWYFITNRWPGGLLTNFSTLKKQIEKLRNMEAMVGGEKWEELTKKEKSSIGKEINRLNKNFEGVKNMLKVPDAIFVIDTIVEKTAIAEAKTLKLPVVALVDSNSDPSSVAFPIPINDDVKEVVTMILGEVEKALE
ncbi:30S ribosomal protein S2 [Candidatus Microgenomates bacterium]|nr:30S ribosomal protein S2 [Candidatus Microgenomates bacterium]